MSVNKDTIISIRAKFLEEVPKNSDQYFDKLDVERVKTNDWWIERFVLSTKSEKAALKALVKAMQWRKTFGVNHFTDDYFPEEFYKLGLYHSLFKDRNGRLVLWCTLRRFHKSSDLALLIRQFLIYQFEKLDRQTSHEGWALVSDAGDSGLGNTDMDFSHFMVEALQSYYPKGPKYQLVVDLPWALNAVAKMALAFSGEQAVTYISKDKLAEYIDPAYIPFHLGGRNDRDMIVVPDGVKPLEQLTHTKFTSDQIKKIYSIYKDELD